MGKATFPFNLTTTLDSHIRLRQAALMEQRGASATMQDVYNEIAEFCGISPYTVSMLKGGSYNPSVILAFLIRDYFRSVGMTLAVDDLFDIEPKEGVK